MSNSIPKLKKGTKALGCAGKGKFFHLQSAVLSTRISPQNAGAFKVAADIVLDSLQSAKRGPSQDKMLFPVLYLYRHCLELKLKELVLLGVRIRLFDLPKVAELLGKHELCPLWTKAKQVILDSYPKDDEARAAEAIINEFHRVDPDGQTLRYGRTKGSLAPRRYNGLPDQIGVVRLRRTMDSVYQYLDNCIAGIDGWWEAGEAAMD